MGKSVLLVIQLREQSQSTMNLCIVSFQAVLLAVLVQYHYINEVEAEKQSYVSVGDFISSLEKKVNNAQDRIRIRMNNIYQRIKKTTKNIVAYIKHQVFKTGTDTKDTVKKYHYEGVKISDLLNSQEQRDLLAVNDLSDTDNMTGEVNYDEEPEAPRQVVLKKKEAPKRKRRIIKKYKKKNKSKSDHHEHLPHEQRLDLSVEKDKAKSAKRIMRQNHKKREKVRITQRKFVKTFPKETNSSEESDEVNRRQPVDIIVHIKMND